MKNLLFILLFFGLKAASQTAFPLYVPTNPDSIKQVVTVNGSPRQVYNIDLVKYRSALTAHDTANALRLLINSAVADKMLRLSGSDFSNSTDYVNTSFTGKVPIVFYNNIPRFLQYPSDYDTLTGGGIKIKSFNVTSSDIFYLIGSNFTVVSGGSGTSSAATITQAVTSGSGVTVNNSTTWLIVNPSSTAPSFALTLPALPSDGQTVTVSFGGSISTGNVVAALTVSPNTSQSLLDAVPSTSADAGETIAYKYNLSNSTWYRVI